MFKIVFNILLFIILISFRCQSGAMTNIKVKPLHPYSVSPFYYNQNEPKQQSYICKFFYIEEVSKASDNLSNRVDTFVSRFIKSDSDYYDFGSYKLYFYRETSKINENFREQIDGMITYNLLSAYKSDILFEYTWSGGEFIGCNFYKNGKVVKKNIKRSY